MKPIMSITFLCLILSGCIFGENSSSDAAEESETTHEEDSSTDSDQDQENRLQLSAGSNHTCALFLDGLLQCLGKNEVGQLGDGTGEYSIFAKDVQPFSNTPVFVVSAFDHNCAILNDATVECWGNNEMGQLGNGSNVSVHYPVIVEGLSSSVQSLALGKNHSCALLDNRTVECWGDNKYGQIGNGTSTTVSAADLVIDYPVSEYSAVEPVVGVVGEVKEIAAGSHHTCALTADDLVYCWGENTAGQLGEFRLDYYNNGTPQLVKNVPSSMKEIFSGSDNNCVISVNGEVWCWGSGYGATPVMISGISGSPTTLSMGEFHVCAILDDGSVECWGKNNYGQLGAGTYSSTDSPIQVTGLTEKVRWIASGLNHTCVLQEDNFVWCWGKNTFGQLGNGSVADPLDPVAIAGFSELPVDVAVGRDHACALLESGVVECWGENDHCQLGDGTDADSVFPVAVTSLSESAENVLAMYDDLSGAILIDGRIQIWGCFDDEIGYEVLTIDPSPHRVLQVVSSESHLCFTLDNGEARCWGDNNEGQLGNGTTSDETDYSDDPVKVENLAGSVSLMSTGEYFSCALISDGSVECWGEKAVPSQFSGSSNPQDSVNPGTISGFSESVSSISSGTTHSCALLIDGTIECWGSQVSEGQLGNGSQTETSDPAPITDLGSSAISIESAGDHSCALVENGDIYCWGRYPGSSESLYPQSVSGFSGPVDKVAVGFNEFYCALLEDQTIECWGDDSFEAIGNKQSSALPVQSLW